MSCSSTDWTFIYREVTTEATSMARPVRFNCSEFLQESGPRKSIATKAPHEPQRSDHTEYKSRLLF